MGVPSPSMDKPARDLLSKCETIAARLPETSVEYTDQHASIFVAGNKRIAWFLNDHHGDGMICLCVKVDPEEKENLIDMDPDKYLRPAYVSRFGWMSIRLDNGEPDWDEVADRLRASYCRVAPKRLVNALEV